MPLSFGVRPEKQKALEERMTALHVSESDLIEKFVRSGGKGGQHLNKTSTCVYLKHVPTGIEVKMQKDRSQSINRFLARRVLIEKLEARSLGKQSVAAQRIGKIRKQKMRRKRRTQKKLQGD